MTYNRNNTYLKYPSKLCWAVQHLDCQSCRYCCCCCCCCGCCCCCCYYYSNAVVTCEI